MLKIYILEKFKKVKKFSKDLLFSIITKTINKLIDLRERIDETPTITLGDMMRKEGYVDCPWCNGLGWLTNKGEPVNENAKWTIE